MILAKGQFRSKPRIEHMRPIEVADSAIAGKIRNSIEERHAIIVRGFVDVLIRISIGQ